MPCWLRSRRFVPPWRDSGPSSRRRELLGDQVVALLNLPLSGLFFGEFLPALLGLPIQNSDIGLQFALPRFEQGFFLGEELRVVLLQLRRCYEGGVVRLC